jgi:hypothetical protein
MLLSRPKYFDFLRSHLQRHPLICINLFHIWNNMSIMNNPQQRNMLFISQGSLPNKLYEF